MSQKTAHVRYTIPMTIIQSTALFYNTSAMQQQQSQIIKKSFNAQKADYHYLYQPMIRKTITTLSVAIIKSHIQPQRTSLDVALSNAQNLAKAPQLVFRVIMDLVQQVSSLSTIYVSAAQNRSCFLDTQVAIINAASLKDVQRKKSAITDLFFHSLRHCEYDRGLITRNGVVESILDTRIYSAHDAEDVRDSVTGRRIQETVAEALFALRLGVQPEKAYSEYHSVYYLLDRSQKRLGVFKPSIINPKEDRYGASEDREAHLAEVANSIIDIFLNTHVVPHTQLLRCTLPVSQEAIPTTGSFQLYVDDTCDLYSKLEGENLFDTDHEKLAVRLDTVANRGLEFQNFEEFALLDLITANNDHHFKNILLKKRAENSWDLVAIDNANSFPWCHDVHLPAYKIRPLHWFKWSTLPQANQPFSDPMIERIKALHMGHMEHVLRDVLVHQETPSSQEHIEGKIHTLRDRCNRIGQLAREKASLRDIARGILALT